MSNEQPEGILEPREKVGVASRSPGQLWQVPTFFVGLAAFIAVLVTAPSRGDASLALFQAELVQLRQGLESGRERPVELVALAESLVARVAQYPRKGGETHFLAGSAYFRLAAQGSPDAVKTNHKKAAQHLDEALALGVAAGDVPALKYRLGFALYEQGTNLKRAIDLMAQSVDKGAERRGQAYGVLVKAYLALPKPNLEAALSASQKQLEFTDNRNLQEMAQARLLRAGLLLQKGQRPDALKELDQIGKTTPRALRVEARLLQARLCEEEGLWNRAIPAWVELLDDAEVVPGGKARVLHALGLAYRNGEPTQLDKALTRWEQAVALGGDDGLAAGLRLGDARIYGSAADAGAALAVWGKVLENVRTPSEYQIKALELKRARLFLENACLYFLEKGDYDQTRKVAELYKKIAAAGVAEYCLAQAAEGLAKELSDTVKKNGPPNDESALKDAEAQFHLAAVEYEEAAAARTDDVQAEAFSRSAQCYLAAKDFAHAGAVLTRFVDVEKNQGRLAEGWLALAESFVAAGDKEKARAAYYKCIEFPLTPFAFRARYQLALEEMDKKNYDQACDILMQNLEAKGTVPDRPAHEKSVFKIADLFFLQHNFDKAVFYYKKAIQTYPHHAGVLAARDQLSDCYYNLAKQAQEKMTGATEEKKAYYQNARQHWLDQGAQVCEALADELEHKARQNPLVQAELNLLRKALFGSAELRFEMNDFNESLRRYENLQDKYRKQVEGLIAGQRIWRFVGVMVETPEQRKKAHTAAVEALKKVKADLEVMPEASDAFRGDGVWTRKMWEDWNRQVESRLSTLPPKLTVIQ